MKRTDTEDIQEVERTELTDWMWEVRERGGQDSSEVPGCAIGHHILELFINIVNIIGEATL